MYKINRTGRVLQYRWHLEKLRNYASKIGAYITVITSLEVVVLSSVLFLPGLAHQAGVEAATGLLFHVKIKRFCL